ncbi:permease [Rhodococcus sp. G-MC3]|uniref:permease n=1 Tax=Rhodococcus sp. G-MC3 TaxID=3046209 RepID=UPI0024BA2E17|nr:permease [Rhodococcus sp. G-MC3]MDJ0392997.1 permease [Rhodococcus sp. G-MC3]
MTIDGTTSVPANTGRPGWVNRAILIAVGAVALIIAYFVLAAFLPRWWSIRVGNFSDQAFSKGIFLGLVLGIACTLVPLLLFFAAWSVRRKRGGKVSAIIALVIAVVVAIPNLLTLTIVLGSNNAAHAGERTLDTEAPGFRGATALGAVIAVVIFALLVFLIVRARRSRTQKRLAGSADAPAV